MPKHVEPISPHLVSFHCRLSAQNENTIAKKLAGSAPDTGPDHPRDANLSCIPIAMDPEVPSDQHFDSASAPSSPVPRLEEVFLCAKCREVLWRPEEICDLKESKWLQCELRTSEDLFASIRRNCRICKLFWATASTRRSGMIPLLDHNLAHGIYFDAKNTSFTKLHLEYEYFQLQPLTCMSTRNLKEQRTC
jgi:hypothetical protein